MLKRLSDYGAVAAKVRALRGKRLKREDFARLLELKSVPEIAAYLKGHPSFGPGLAQTDTESVHRLELENTLRAYVLRQYLTLFHYVSHPDDELLRYPVFRAETEQIMAFMRLASAGRSADYQFALPPFFDRHSRIRYGMLSQASTYDEMLEAVKRTDFYPALLRLRREDGAFPPYILVENAMRSYYYRSMFALIEKTASGEVRQLLMDMIGLQADMINVTAILRILQYFPALLDDIGNYLLPVTYRLKPAFLRQLSQAGSFGAAVALMKTSAYGRFFTRQSFDNADDYYSEMIYESALRHFTGHIPSVHMPMLYLLLRETELQNVIHAVECVRYGVKPEQAWGYLTGYRG